MSSLPSSSNQAIAAAQRILEITHNDGQLAELITARDPRVRHLDSFVRQNILRTALVYQAWKKIGRQVLAMHPEVVDEVKVASSDRIPGEVLRVLPYMNPMVVFADPPVFSSWVERPQADPHGERAMRLLGFYTYGTVETVGQNVRDMHQYILATNDTDANRFGMLLIFEVLDGRGEVVDVELNSITLYFAHTMTLAETVDALVARYHWNEDTDTKAARRWMRQVMSIVVGCLFYLCSTTLEAEKVPAKAVKHLGRGIVRKPLSFYRVGWTIGAALTRYRQSRLNSTSTQADITHQQDPQHRRGHFKMQPCGKGRLERKLIYVSPYWTHVERLGEEGVNTARNVPSDGRGEARDSVRTVLQMQEALSHLQGVS